MSSKNDIKVVFLVAGFLCNESDYMKFLGSVLAKKYKVHYIGLKNHGFFTPSGLREDVLKKCRKRMLENNYSAEEIGIVAHSLGFVTVINLLERKKLGIAKVYGISGYLDLRAVWFDKGLKENSLLNRVCFKLFVYFSLGPFSRVSENKCAANVKVALGDKDLILNLHNNVIRNNLISSFKKKGFSVEIFEGANHAFNYEKHRYSPMCLDTYMQVFLSAEKFFDNKQ